MAPARLSLPPAGDGRVEAPALHITPPV
jgi:hypothetical protein